jgi:uncharacterized protein (DUF433 family)
LAYDTWEAARLISWSNKQEGIGPLGEAELTRWIDTGLGGLDWAYTYEEDGEEIRCIDFPTLISLRLICLLRFQEVPLETITEATSQLREDLGVECPYASKLLWNFPEESVSLVKNEAVSLIANGIFLCSEKLSSHKLEFGADGVASAWLPVKGIVIDPRVVSGSSCVVGTRTPTWVFPGMLEGGDTVKVLAKGYRLAEDQVRNALDWEKQLDAAGV